MSAFNSCLAVKLAIIRDHGLFGPNTQNFVGVNGLSSENLVECLLTILLVSDNGKLFKFYLNTVQGRDDDLPNKGRTNKSCIDRSSSKSRTFMIALKFNP